MYFTPIHEGAPVEWVGVGHNKFADGAPDFGREVEQASGLVGSVIVEVGTAQSYLLRARCSD